MNRSDFRRFESRFKPGNPRLLAWILLLPAVSCHQTVEPIALAPAPQVSAFALVDATMGNTIELLVDHETIDLALLPTRDLAIVVTFSGKGDAILMSYDGTQSLERCPPYSVPGGDSHGHFKCWDPPFGGTGVHEISARPGRRCGSGAIWGATQGLTLTVTDSGSGTAFSCGKPDTSPGPTCDPMSAYPEPTDGAACGGSALPIDAG